VIINCIVGWGNLAQITGQAEVAAKVCGVVEMLLQTNHEKLNSPEREMYEQVMIALRSQLNDDVFAKVWSEGHAMRMEQVIKLVLDKTHE
jgi:hypothetical protein